VAGAFLGQILKKIGGAGKEWVGAGEMFVIGFVWVCFFGD